MVTVLALGISFQKPARLLAYGGPGGGLFWGVAWVWWYGTETQYSSGSVCAKLNWKPGLCEPAITHCVQLAPWMVTRAHAPGLKGALQKQPGPVQVTELKGTALSSNTVTV